MIRRSILRDDIEIITDKRLKTMIIDDDYFYGIVGLLDILETKKPLYAKSDKEKKIVDKGYQWLQLAPFKDNYWLTVCIVDDVIKDSYFDITAGNHFDDMNDPWFIDLYLDIIAPYQKKPILIDEDELWNAYDHSLINRSAYDEAYVTAQKIVDIYFTDQDDYYDHLHRYYRMLKDNN